MMKCYEELIANPISAVEQSGVVNNASFIRESDLEEVPFRLNASRKGLRLAGKIDVVTSSTTNLTVGGSFNYSDVNSATSSNALFNSQNNGQLLANEWRTYARFTQRFENSNDEESASLIKDAFITFQVDYTNNSSTLQNRNHEDRLSHYGYVGKFTSTREDLFDPVTDTALVVDANGNPTGEVLEGFFSNEVTTLYEYEAGDLNPILSNYTSNYYDIFEGNPIGNFEQIEDLPGGLALINGSAPTNVYNLYTAPGAQFNSYSLGNSTQFRVSASGSASIKGHAIQIGFEYEQRTDRSYNVFLHVVCGL